MAYNAVELNINGGKNKYVYSLKDMSGGVSFCDNGRSSCFEQMDNVIYEKGRLIARGGYKTLFADVLSPFHSMCEKDFHGSVIFHSGSKIYRFDGTETSVIKENAGDCKSVFLAMNGKVYLYTHEREIFEIKSDFSCQKVEPYIPNLINSRDHSMNDYDIDEPMNMLTPRVKCTYFEPTTLDVIFTTPFDIDETQAMEVYIDGEKDTDRYVTKTATCKFSIRGLGSDVGIKEVSVVFSVAGEDEKTEEFLSKSYGCDIAFCYGGTTNDGTRAFLTGNEDHPGVYLRSKLKNPLYFPDTDEELLGDGGENVTAVRKRYEKLFFFTRSHIYSMKYSFSEQEGASFPVSEINTNVGCDMKNTVRSIDNTPVFADSLSGIHLLQSTDVFDELNVRHISANIEGEGENSFEFAHDGGVYSSCDHDRKYYICNGKTLYIWDYGKTPYYSTGDHKAAETRLSWYRYDAPQDCVYIFSHRGKLYFVCSSAETSLVEYTPGDGYDTAISDGEEKHIPVSASFMTKSYDFGSYDLKKRLCDISFRYESEKEGCAITLEVYGNGKKYCSFDLELADNEYRDRVHADDVRLSEEKIRNDAANNSEKLQLEREKLVSKNTSDTDEKKDDNKEESGYSDYRTQFGKLYAEYLDIATKAVKLLTKDEVSGEYRRLYSDEYILDWLKSTILSVDEQKSICKKTGIVYK